MFVNTHVFINSWWGGRGGGLLEAQESPPPSPPLASGTVRRYGIYGSQDVVRNCNCTVWSFVY